jgi:hypothetical protein
MSALEHISDDQFLDLVNGLMSDSHQRAALEHARACPECATRLRSFGAVHEMAAALAPASLAAAATPGAARSPVRQQFAVAAAVTVVISTATLFVWSALRPVPRPIGDVAWLPPPSPGVITRDSAVAEDVRILEGLAAYGRRDVIAARRLLEPVHTTGALEHVRRIYLANTQLKLGEARAAIATLRDVPFSEVPEPWRSHSLESMARALSETGQPRSADSVLKLLEQRADSIGAAPGAGP